MDEMNSEYEKELIKESNELLQSLMDDLNNVRLLMTELNQKYGVENG